MRAKIITIGDEILVGQTVDTNSAYIAKKLNSIGVKISEIISITDTKSHIINSVDKAINDHDFIILTGGLGPTNDDITKNALVDYFDDELIEHPEILAKIKGFFERFNKPFLDVNELQAMLPKQARIIENDLGTASGMWFKKGKANILSLPGVPFEMKGLINKFIDLIKVDYEIGNFYHKTTLVAGIGESYFAEMIEDWESQNRIDGIGVAYLPSVGSLKLRLTGTLLQKAIIDERIKFIEDKFPKYIVGSDINSLEEKIGLLLLSKKAVLGTVESCTAGGLANKIVSIPGSSAYYSGSIVSYSDAIKQSIVGVLPETLKQHGAVSEETVIEMAKNGRTKLNVDYCISISGVAGPDGGTEEKPVGTVWIAIATPDQVLTKKFNFGYNRARNIQSTIMAALNFLRLTLMT